MYGSSFVCTILQDINLFYVISQELSKRLSFEKAQERKYLGQSSSSSRSNRTTKRKTNTNSLNTPLSSKSRKREKSAKLKTVSTSVSSNSNCSCMCTSQNESSIQESNRCLSPALDLSNKKHFGRGKLRTRKKDTINSDHIQRPCQCISAVNSSTVLTQTQSTEGVSVIIGESNDCTSATTSSTQQKDSQCSNDAALDLTALSTRPQNIDWPHHSPPAAQQSQGAEHHPPPNTSQSDSVLLTESNGDVMLAQGSTSLSTQSQNMLMPCGLDPSHHSPHVTRKRQDAEHHPSPDLLSKSMTSCGIVESPAAAAPGFSMYPNPHNPHHPSSNLPAFTSSTPVNNEGLLKTKPKHSSVRNLHAEFCSNIAIGETETCAMVSDNMDVGSDTDIIQSSQELRDTGDSFVHSNNANIHVADNRDKDNMNKDNVASIDDDCDNRTRSDITHASNLQVSSIPEHVVNCYENKTNSENNTDIATGSKSNSNTCAASRKRTHSQSTSKSQINSSDSDTDSSICTPKKRHRQSLLSSEIVKTPPKMHLLAPKPLGPSQLNTLPYVPLPKASPKRKELNRQVRHILPKSFTIQAKSPSPTKAAAMVLSRRAKMTHGKSPIKLLPKPPEMASDEKAKEFTPTKMMTRRRGRPPGMFLGLF